MANICTIIALMLVLVPLVLLGGFLAWVALQCGLDMIEERRRRMDELAVRDAIERNRKR